MESFATCRYVLTQTLLHLDTMEILVFINIKWRDCWLTTLNNWNSIVICVNCFSDWCLLRYPKDDDVNASNHNYKTDAVKHPNHINPNSGTSVLPSTDLEPNEITNSDSPTPREWFRGLLSSEDQVLLSLSLSLYRLLTRTRIMLSSVGDERDRSTWRSSCERNSKFIPAYYKK